MGNAQNSEPETEIGVGVAVGTRSGGGPFWGMVRSRCLGTEDGWWVQFPGSRTQYLYDESDLRAYDDQAYRPEGWTD